jgi:hypothetical protein
MNLLEKAENELFQIVRFHKDDIKIRMKVSSDYGVFFYMVTLKVCGIKKHYFGRHLFKRYNEIVRDLKFMYGDNLHIYGSKIINKL